MDDILIYLVGPALVGALGGFGVGRIKLGIPRISIMIGWLLLPLAIYTVVLAMADSADGGFWVWWQAGLLFLLLPYCCWMVGAIAAFAGIGRKSTK